MIHEKGSIYIMTEAYSSVANGYWQSVVTLKQESNSKFLVMIPQTVDIKETNAGDLCQMPDNMSSR